MNSFPGSGPPAVLAVCSMKSVFMAKTLNCATKSPPLPRKYGIVTPYTTYLIVEDEDRRGVAANLRSFQAMTRDLTVRQEAAASWIMLNNQASGDVAVAGSQLNESLKHAMQAPANSAVAAGPAFGRRSLDLPAASAPMAVTAMPAPVQAREKLVNYSQQAQFVGAELFPEQ